jgi:hypothetical protein
MARVVVIDGSREARALCAQLELEGYDVVQFADPDNALDSEPAVVWSLTLPPQPVSPATPSKTTTEPTQL